MSNERPQMGSWLSDETTALLDTGISSKVTGGVRDMWTGFIGFFLKDNVLEVAVGLIVATSFVPVVNSLVSDIILPFLGLLPFMSRSLEEKFFILKQGHASGSITYDTRAQAIQDGAVILPYGAFIDQLVNFVGLGLIIYLMRASGLYEYFSTEKVVEHPVKCPFCRKEISSEAKRCGMCTTWLDGREDMATSTLSA